MNEDILIFLCVRVYKHNDKAKQKLTKSIAAEARYGMFTQEKRLMQEFVG